MKPILLIYPPFESKFRPLLSRGVFPIGLLYLGSYLKSKGMEVRVVDFSYPPSRVKIPVPTAFLGNKFGYARYGWSDDEIIFWLKENLSKFHNVVGVSSLMSSVYTGGYHVAELIKQVSGNVKVVLGGPHATSFPDHVAKNSVVDFICLGEGEEVFYNFLNGKEAVGIYPVGDVKQGKFVYQRRFIENMDSLPFPDIDLLWNNRKLDSLMVTFSRGCPHICSFCGSRLIQGNSWRAKSVSRVLEELFFYVSKWGIRKFEIEDDNLCPGKVGMDWLFSLCTKIIDYVDKKKLPKLRLHVPHGIPVYATAKSDFCSKLWESGFRDMVFPLESTNPLVLKDMKKEFTPKNWKMAIKNWSKYESSKHYPTEIIFGYPFVETIESMLSTIIDVTNEKALNWPSHFRLNKGLEIFQRCLTAGYVSNSYDPINSQLYFVETERFTLENLREISSVASGANYGTMREFNVFRDVVPEILVLKDFTFYRKKMLDCVVAKGKFSFSHGGVDFVRLLLSRLGYKGRAKLSVNNEKNSIIFRGMESSVVYTILGRLVME